MLKPTTKNLLLWFRQRRELSGVLPRGGKYRKTFAKFQNDIRHEWGTHILAAQYDDPFCGTDVVTYHNDYYAAMEAAWETRTESSNR